MAKTYLDETGLATLWGKIKTYVTNAVKVTGVKGNAETSYRTGNVNLTADNVGALPYDGTIFNTNTFASDKYKKLYISKIDNAFFALNKRYNVTVTYDGTDIPNVAQFFDGSYEGNSLHIAEGKTATFTLDFSNGSGQKFAGYPYGYIYVSFYNRCIPDTITGRVYNNYASQGVGWHDITFEKYDASIYRARQSYYGLQTLEITIAGSSDTPYGYTSPVEIEMQIDRPDPTHHNPIINKYSSQTLYYTLTAPKFIGALQGNADTATTATTATKATQDKNGKDITTWYQSLGNNMTDIASGTDLNTIITPGNYRATSTSIGSSLVNCPVATWFIMRVGYADGKSTGWEYQEILVGNSGVRWYRHHNGGTWASWQQFAKNTDTVTTVTTTGSGNAVTGITASNGALTVTKGSTFLTQHQDISGKADKSSTVSNVAYDSTNKKITKTINGTTSDVVTSSDIVNPSVLVTALPINGYTMRKLNVGGVEIDNLVRIITSETASSELKSAYPYSAETADLLFPSTTVVSQMITEAMSEAGNGDMLKAVYDSNNDGIVDNSKTWNGYGLGTATNVIYQANPLYIPARSASDTYFTLIKMTYTPGRLNIVRYDDSGYVNSITPAAGDSSTKAATTAFVSTAIANAEPAIVDITSQFSSSNSRLVVRKAVKCGKNVNLMIGILRSASWSSNTSSDLTATLTSDYLPLLQSTTSYSWSTGSIEGILDGNALSFRNCSGSTISASSGNYIELTFTYIYDDGTIS